MTLRFPSREFDEAVSAACHDTASEEQLHALNNLLRNDPAALDEYILRLELHSRLASDPGLFSLDEVTHPGSVEPGPARPTQPLPQRAAWALAWAACFLMVALGWWALSSRQPSERTGTTSKAVALLNRGVDLEWDHAGEPPRMGAPLEPGRLRLKSGLAQIVFHSGARITIEGPTELDVVAPGEAACTHGRLMAEIPPQAKGFILRTPRRMVADRDTVFAVDLRAHRSEVHVFRGGVESAPVATGASREYLRSGEAVVVAGTNAHSSIPADPNRFDSLFDFGTRSSDAQVLWQEQWRAASKRLDDDPYLLVHFDFEQTGAGGWQLPNISKRTDVAADGTIVGCQWTEGRWPDKRGLEFRGVSDRVRLEVSGEYEALTLAAWVRVQGLDRQINSIFMSDGFGAGTVHWSIRQDGVLGLTVIGSEAGEYQICASRPALTLKELGLWVHLAAVVDGPRKRVVHYLNGVAISDHHLKVEAPYRIGIAELGNWTAHGFPRNDPFMIRNFSGAMDEFCLFSRALSPGEVRTLMSAGKPQPEPLNSTRR